MTDIKFIRFQQRMNISAFESQQAQQVFKKKNRVDSLLSFSVSLFEDRGSLCDQVVHKRKFFKEHLKSGDETDTGKISERFQHSPISNTSLYLQSMDKENNGEDNRSPLGLRLRKATLATKGNLNGEHENLPEEADPLFKLARLKMKTVQENITLCPCPLIIAIFVIYPGEALVMPGQLKATLTITDIESSKKQREN